MDRLLLDQAVSLLFSAHDSTLCAQLMVSIGRMERGGAPTELITALQNRVTATESYHQRLPGAISLGELWAKVHRDRRRPSRRASDHRR